MTETPNLYHAMNIRSDDRMEKIILNDDFFVVTVDNTELLKVSDDGVWIYGQRIDPDSFDRKRTFDLFHRMCTQLASGMDQTAGYSLGFEDGKKYAFQMIRQLVSESSVG